jgi:hypothetical protein
MRTAGLRAAGTAPISQQVLWGVHRIQPGVDYDPAAIQQMPLDGLTQRYLAGDEPRTFRVDLADGEYRVTVVAPAVGGTTTPVRVGGATLRLGGHSTMEAQVDVTVEGGSLELTVGGTGPWACAGIVVQPHRPEIAHLPAAGLRAEQDALITATVTAPHGVRGVHLRYRSGETWVELSMQGDGAAFRATIPADCLQADQLVYELVAEGSRGLTGRRSACAGIVRGFRAPVVTSTRGPEAWTPRECLSFRLALEHGPYAREVRLHYREADQNRSFRVASAEGGRSGEFVFEIDPRHLDDAYDLLYYFEVVDVLGGGSFYPDPFREKRYFVVHPL